MEYLNSHNITSKTVSHTQSRPMKLVICLLNALDRYYGVLPSVYKYRPRSSNPPQSNRTAQFEDPQASPLNSTKAFTVSPSRLPLTKIIGVPEVFCWQFTQYLNPPNPNQNAILHQLGLPHRCCLHRVCLDIHRIPRLRFRRSSSHQSKHLRLQWVHRLWECQQWPAILFRVGPWMRWSLQIRGVQGLWVRRSCDRQRLS